MTKIFILGIWGIMLVGCASNTQTSTMKNTTVKKGNKNQFYLNKMVHYICHKKSDAIDATATMITMNIREGSKFLDRGECIFVAPKDNVKVQRLHIEQVIVEGKNVPAYKIRILSINGGIGRMSQESWSGDVWMIDPLEDYR